MAAYLGKWLIIDTTAAIYTSPHFQPKMIY